MKQKFLLFFLFIILFETPQFAQNKYTFSQFGNETLDYIKQPLKWDGSDQFKSGLISAVTFFIIETNITRKSNIFLEEPKRLRNLVQVFLDRFHSLDGIILHSYYFLLSFGSTKIF